MLKLFAFCLVPKAQSQIISYKLVNTFLPLYFRLVGTKNINMIHPECRD
jgi:hypothetical protein